MVSQQSFDFEQAVDQLLESKDALVRACRETRPTRPIGGRSDAAEEIALACKHAIRDAGLSREQALDKVNELLGLSETDGSEGKPISPHIWNHYLSKPAEYPLPAYVVMALVRVTGALEPLQTMAEPVGARVISGEEAKLMHLGKIENLHAELLRVRRELKKG